MFPQNMTKETCTAMNPLLPLVGHCCLEKISGCGLFSKVSINLKYHRMDEVGRDLKNASGPTPLRSYTKLSSFIFGGSVHNFGIGIKKNERNGFVALLRPLCKQMCSNSAL